VSAVTATAPVVVVVGFPNSIHVARWINASRRHGFRIVLFPSVLGSPCPELQPFREVRSRADVDAFALGEIGVYPADLITVLTEADMEDSDCYPLAAPATRTPRHLLPHPVALSRAVKAIRPDLVHSMELQHGGYLALDTRRRLGAQFPPWLASSWGSDLFLYRRMGAHRPVLRRLLRSIDALHSDCARDFAWAAAVGFTGIRFPQMPASGGVDFSVFPDPAGLPPPSRRKSIVVKGYHGWSGRGLHILLALHLIAPKLRDFRIVVTHGGRPMADMVARLAAQDGLDISMDPYLGSSAEAVTRLAGARLAVGYGISDGISTTLLEAMAVGAFMIQATTCCGGEWITPGRTGLQVPPHDVVALSEAVLLAATNDELVDDAVVVNRRTVEERWSASTNGALIADGYRAVLARAAAGTAHG